MITEAKPLVKTETCTIAIAGNPNCGKTTLFNGLTGSNQRIGNWPGVTVERKENTGMVEKRSILLIFQEYTRSLHIQKMKR